MRQASLNPVLLWIIFGMMIFTPVATPSESILDIQFMTENYPPYNYSEKGELKGIYVNILLEIAKKK
jgi:hypothetical protein